MKAKIYAITKISDNEGEYKREPRIGEFNYGDPGEGNFSDFIDSLIDCVNMFSCKAKEFNEARILDTTVSIGGYRVVFTRDDGTIVDEVSINDETIDEVNDLVVAFTTL